MRDRIVSVALLVAAAAFAALVFITRPTGITTPAPVAVVDSASVPRGTVLHALQLPPGITNVDLEWMPERLTNEAAPSSLRDVVVVRGVPGVASVETPAVISWSEAGVVYWLISASHSTAELIRIADRLAP